MKNCRQYVRPPMFRHGYWVIDIVEGKSPLAPVIDSIQCPGGRESAFQVYRQTIKDMGYGF